jgi:pSer/pThr/pTyr-binding forkhead associated (FHA) protein
VPVLVFIAGPKAGTEIPVGIQIVVGRDLGAADVILDADPDVSRRHATFSPAGAGLTVEDLGSTNGTFVNDRPIVAPTPLTPGDVVRFGNTLWHVAAPGAATLVGGPRADT